MPIYEYVCQGCGHDLEALQKLSDAPLSECPKCGKAQLKKMVSAAGFRLKGSGWYETDFKSGGDKKKNLTASESAAPTANTAETKTESKTESKTETKSEVKVEKSATPEKKVTPKID